MKFFVAFALIVAVASAAVINPTRDEVAEIQQIIAAINSPSTDPATAAVLEQMLQDLIGVAVGPAIVDQTPVAVGPAMVDQNPIVIGPAIVGAGDIAVGPAMIDFPLPDGGAVTAPVEAGPVGVAPVATPVSSPLVQIIVNVKSPAGAAPGPVAEPVQIIDTAPIVATPVQIVDMAPIVPEPVQIIDMVPIGVGSMPVIDPVQVADIAPVVVSPVAIGTPILPAPAVTLPEELN